MSTQDVSESRPGRPERAVRHRFRRVAKPLLLVLLGLGSGLALAEFILRIAGPMPFAVDGDRIRLSVNAGSLGSNDTHSKLDRRIFIWENSLGFRGADPPRSFDRHLTIVAVGGSTTECLLLDEGDDWPARLRRRLAPAIGRLWVNNAGLDGHSTFGHQALIDAHIARLSPDIVLYLVGVNDIGRGEPNAFDEGSRPIARSDAPTPGPWVRLARHSRVASLALNAYRMVRAFRWSLGHGQVDLLSVEHVDKNADNGPTMDHDPYLRGYQQRLAALVASSREHGMQPVLVTQPLLYGAGVDPTTGADLATVRIRDLGGSTAWRLMERYNDVTRRLGRVADVPVIDLAAEMPKDSR